MNKELIYISLYKFLKLPDCSNIRSVKKVKKYILADLNYSQKKGNIIEDKVMNSKSIVSKEYEETFFNDMVVVSCSILSEKNLKNKYDDFINKNTELTKEIKDKLDIVINKYSDDLPHDLENNINENFIEMGSVYYFEIEKNVILMNAYLKDIKDNKYPKKMKYQLRYFFEYFIPSYWGYLILAFTLILFLAGIIYAIV